MESFGCEVAFNGGSVGVGDDGVAELFLVARNRDGEVTGAGSASRGSTRNG